MFHAHLSIYKILLSTNQLNHQFSLLHSIKTACAIKWVGELGVVGEELAVEVTHN